MMRPRVVIALLLILIAAFYVAKNPEHDRLDDAARKAAPGKFVRLSDGVTHYKFDGPETGRTVVLVHGFSVPMYIWDSTASALASAGYRVLRYDEFGRGWSDRPSIDYTADLFDRQLRELLDSLHVSKPDLGGVSMGGWVTGTFAGRHPDRVRSLILVDPVAGDRPTSLPFATRLRFMPIVGQYVYQTMDEPGLAAGQGGDFVHPERFPDWAARYDQQVRFRGFGHAMLSTRREQSKVSLDSVYQTVDKGGMPVLLLWGTKDKTVPFERNERVRKAITRAEFHPIEDAGHLPILEQAAHTDSLILAFLAKTP